jgi:PHD/YefM family antitoxin component YafN of YafNO toxin-antitoxin module
VAARETIARQRPHEDRKVTIEDLRRISAVASDIDDKEVLAAAWDETDHLLASPENARRLSAAIASLDASHSAPSDTNEAPTTHRPERSDEQ